MKKIMSALVVAGVMVFGYGVNAENADKAKTEKKAEKADKFMSMLKELDPAKYETINTMTDAKAKAAAAKAAVIELKLAELQKTDAAKYKEIVALKTSDVKAYNTAINKLLSSGKAAKK